MSYLNSMELSSDHTINFDQTQRRNHSSYRAQLPPYVICQNSDWMEIAKYSSHNFKDGQRWKLLSTQFSEMNFLLILTTFDSKWWYFITADLPMNLQARLCLFSSCGSWVMLQNSVEKKVLHKATHYLNTYHILSCFLKCTHCITLMLNHYTKQQKSIFWGQTDDHWGCIPP